MPHPTIADGEATSSSVIRPYTPINLDKKTPGFFDLMIKHYKDGKMSSSFFNLQPGQMIEIKGPIKKYNYELASATKKHIGMIAGGTGITPMLQIMQHAIQSAKDKRASVPKMTLLFANVSEADILLKEEIDSLAAAHPDLLQVHYTVDQPIDGKNWRGFVGYVSDEMIAKTMPPPSSQSDILICGPPPMMTLVCGQKSPDKQQGELSGLLKQRGYTSENVYKF